MASDECVNASDECGKAILKGRFPVFHMLRFAALVLAIILSNVFLCHGCCSLQSVAMKTILFITSLSSTSSRVKFEPRAIVCRLRAPVCGPKFPTTRQSNPARTRATRLFTPNLGAKTATAREVTDYYYAPDRREALLLSVRMSICTSVRLSVCPPVAYIANNS